MILRNITRDVFLKNVMRNMSEARSFEYDFVYQCLCKLDVNTILDFGCRESNLANYLAKLGYESYGIDINVYQHPSFNFIRANIFEYDFKMEFDMIIAISTIEHIGLPFYGQKVIDSNGDIHAMQRLNKYLKKYFIVTAPSGKFVFAKDFARTYDHNRLKMLSEGFNIITEEYYGKMKDVWRKTDKETADKFCSVFALLLEKMEEKVR